MSFLSQFTPYSFPTLGLVRLPEVTISTEDKAKVGLGPNASNVVFMKHVIWRGYKAKVAAGRFTGFTESQVRERLIMEFAVFEKTGIIDYLLLVWDILKWCDDNGIARGPGRGSVCGSLSCYFLGITKVDPLRYKLNFTRFLSEARAKPKVIDGITYADGKNLCDIDSDISFINRSRVISYVESKYAGKTCKISTRLQLTGKTALKDTLKIYLGFDDGEARVVSDFIEAHFGKVEDLDKAAAKGEFKKWLTADSRHKEAYDIARSIEGLNIAKGQHPSGVFISYYPLDGNVPVELSKNKETTISYDMHVTSTLGPKIDLLGLRSIDLISETAKQVGIDPDDIDVEDSSIYDYLGKTDLYYGLFQIESGLTKDVTVKVGPRCITDLCACLALSRPGSLRYIDDFVRFVKEGAFKPVYPSIDEILKPTGNILIYQEQVNEIGQQVYRMSAVDADEVRRAIGKKIREEMAKWEPVLYANGKTEGIPESVTKYFWDVCNASADYLFSLNHCAGYSFITAQTAFLKANHPREFVLSLLKLSKHEPDSSSVVASIIGEAKQMKIDVLPPDIAKSGDDFTIEGDSIRFGLSHIRGISEATMVKLVSFRRDFATKFEVFNAAQEAKISISVLAGLIFCGAIESKTKRSRLALEAQVYNLLTDREKQLVHQVALNGMCDTDDLLDILVCLKERTDEKGKPYIRDSRWTTLMRDYAPYKAMYLENSKSDDLAAYIFERTFLGFSYSHTLHEIFSAKVEGLRSIGEILKQPKDTRVRFAAFVDEVKRATSRNKKNYLKIAASDESGVIKVMLFGDDRINMTEQLKKGPIVSGDIVIVHGKVAEGGAMFADNVVPQPCPVRTTKAKETL